MELTLNEENTQLESLRLLKGNQVDRTTDASDILTDIDMLIINFI